MSRWAVIESCRAVACFAVAPLLSLVERPGVAVTARHYGSVWSRPDTKQSHVTSQAYPFAIEPCCAGGMPVWVLSHLPFLNGKEPQWWPLACHARTLSQPTLQTLDCDCQRMGAPFPFGRSQRAALELQHANPVPSPCCNGSSPHSLSGSGPAGSSDGVNNTPWPRCNLRSRRPCPVAWRTRYDLHHRCSEMGESWDCVAP